MNKSHRGFTLVEIMIVVAIIAILAAISIPELVTSRKMTRQNKCLAGLQVIEQAKGQMALANGLASNPGTYDTAELYPYLKEGALPTCPITGTISENPLMTAAECSLHGTVTGPTPLSNLTD